ncbi:hypothetical protein AB0L57_27505 [Nocardia sp. NPDC052254]|uniref:hypothetical protein n=1 Tax=Nocardia sp. NPDC052254 TaxID=3155681 RepID=UPI00344178B7
MSGIAGGCTGSGTERTALPQGADLEGVESRREQDDVGVWMSIGRRTDSSVVVANIAAASHRILLGRPMFRVDDGDQVTTSKVTGSVLGERNG